MKKIFERRLQNCEGILVQEMRLFDEESHRQYFRMSRETFDILLEKLWPYIKHGNNHRNPVTIVLRLAITLRILVTGDFKKNLSHSALEWESLR